MAHNIPMGAYLKDLSPLVNQHTIPHAMQVFSPLDPEIWGKVVVSEGEVNLFLAGSEKPIRCTRESPGIIPADAPYRLESAGKPVRFQIHYYHEAKLADADELSALLAAAPARRRGAPEA
ncbi:MAG: hypothetical protein IIA40_09370 [SAR324 cluster bacterium]|nr:hypothetical protein [SAR324 cluster bacterium]